MQTKFWNGRLYSVVPPRRESPCSGVLRRLEQARTCKVASIVFAPALRRRTAARPPAVAHAVPTSSPRPREHRAAPRGRDGGDRDDGSGDSGDGAGGGGGGGGGSDPPPRRSGARVLARGRAS